MKKSQVNMLARVSILILLALSQEKTIAANAPHSYDTNWAFWKKTTVEINNRLSGNLTIIVHCKSKNDDLGVKTIAPNSSWSFQFRPNIFGITLFFCHFRWAQQSHWFDIYDASRDDVTRPNSCTNCSWNVYQDMLCSHRCYGWNK